ncbi:MAG: DUF2914 domain-containing protein [Gammaproteobacteria bacterium]|nr:DUF2914 domain-containing protein [Gammaproteobacteria bacterium]
MTMPVISHKLAAFFLLLLLINPAFAEEKPAAAEEPAAADAGGAAPADTGSAAETTPAEPEQAQQEAPKTGGEDKRQIARAQFTTGIADREPTDDIVMLPSNNDKIFFFTELVNFNGQTIKHRWEYEGKVMAEVEFKVESSRWRVHSSKNIQPEWKGIWNVIVLDENNNPLKVTSFEVVEPSPAVTP